MFKKKQIFAVEQDPTDNEDKKRCEISKIMDEIGEILKKVDPRSLQIFLELIDPDNTGFARKDRYLKAVKAISLFMAVDKDMSHSLSQSELGTLIWLLKGEEPSDENLYSTIETMDANGDAAIELGEWLEFISTIDENTIRNVIIRPFNVKTHNKMLPYKKRQVSYRPLIISSTSQRALLMTKPHPYDKCPVPETTYN